MERLFAYGFLFVGLTLGLVAVPAEVETLQVASRVADFAVTEGKVTTRYTKEHQRGPDTEVVEFDYRVGGIERHGDNHLTRIGDDRQTVNRLIASRSGDDFLRVYYDPEEPSVVTIHRDVNLVWPLGIIGVTGLCFMAGVDTLLKDKRRRGER